MSNIEKEPSEGNEQNPKTIGQIGRELLDMLHTPRHEYHILQLVFELEARLKETELEPTQRKNYNELLKTANAVAALRHATMLWQKRQRVSQMTFREENPLPNTVALEAYRILPNQSLGVGKEELEYLRRVGLTESQLANNAREEEKIQNSITKRRLEQQEKICDVLKRIVFRQGPSIDQQVAEEFLAYKQEVLREKRFL